MQEDTRTAAAPPAEEEGLDLALDVTGFNGHTELSFSKGQCRVSWQDAALIERDLVAALVKTGSLFGFKPFTVDEDGKPKDPITKVLSRVRGKKGQIIFKGDVKKLKLFAQEMVEGELRDNRIVMAAQEDGTWKKLALGEWKPEQGKKEKVTSSPPVGGG